MSQLNVNAIRSSNGTGDAISLAAASNTCTANITNFPHRNLLFNGAMNVSQRHGTTSANVASGNTTNHSYILDRWQVSNANGGGTFAVQQVEDGPAGFNYSQKITTSVADDGGADSFCVVQQRIEGYNGNQLEFGTSDAKTVTISFWVKSSLTGTFGASLVAGNYDKMYVFQYTISSANTWEKKTVTIAGPTSGGTYYKTNSRYCVLYFDLGSGSNGEASAANNWAATGTWMYGHRISGNQKVSTNANATWQITGVQLEVSDYASEFELKKYSEDLRDCQRYFCKTSIYEATGSSGDDEIYMRTLYFPTQMRATPTLAGSSGYDLTGSFSSRESGVEATGNPTLRNANNNSCSIGHNDGGYADWLYGTVHMQAEL